MNKLVVTLWRSFSRGRRHTYSWREFIDTFVKDPETAQNKRSVAGYSLGAFLENRRSLPRVEQVFALVLDFDQGDTTIEQASRLFPNMRGVTYTTFSHTIEYPKLRLVLLLDRPVDALEYERLWYWAAQKIKKAKHELDESARDASRFWYLPSRAPGAPYEWRELEGAPLDVSAALREAPIHTRPFPAGGPKKASKTRASPAPDSGKGREIVCASKTFFGRAFSAAGLAIRELKSGALSVVCPWEDTHTTVSNDDTSAVVLPPTTGALWGAFRCLHSHCAERQTPDLLGVLPASALEIARREHGAGLVRASVRRGFVQRSPAYEGFAALERLVLRCYPVSGGAPIIWTVKIGSRAHVDGLDSATVEMLRGRLVDLALRGREIIGGRFSDPPIGVTR